MGIFDFMKNAGKEIEKEADTAASLQKAVQAMGLNIRNLHVSFDDGVATVRGEANSVKDREMARLVIGNHKGVEKVNDDGLRVAPQPAGASGTSASGGSAAAASPQPDSQMYTVKSGDTLSEISKRFYGEAGKYRQIFDANTPMLDDPDEIYPGQVLRIPAER